MILMYLNFALLTIHFKSLVPKEVTFSISKCKGNYFFRSNKDNKSRKINLQERLHYKILDYKLFNLFLKLN